MERDLQKGQANDLLEGLHVALANKSTTKQSTRAWAGVQNAQSHVLSHACLYQRAWQALKHVGTPEDLLFLPETGCKGSCNSQGHHNGQAFWTRK